MNSELTVQTTITEIVPRVDKNTNRYYQLTVTNSPQPFYAFSVDWKLTTDTLSTLTDAPQNLLNRLVLVTYYEQANRDRAGTFFRVKQIELVR